MAKVTTQDFSRIARAVQSHEQGPRDNRMPATPHHPVAGDSLPPPGLDYQVLICVGGVWIVDWPRLH